MPDSVAQYMSLAAAVVSAGATIFAARAALRSADSAHTAMEANDFAERRSVLRELAVTTSQVEGERMRIEEEGQKLKRSYRDLFSFSGTSGSGLLAQHISEVDEKVSSSTKRAVEVDNLVRNLQDLKRASLEEIHTVQTRVAQTLARLRSAREGLEREGDSVESQCAQFRERVLRRP